MLRITLRAGEKVAVNGAVLRAPRRMTVELLNGAAVLRGREIMTPEEATTPARRLYFATMMAYLEPERLTEYQETIVAALSEVQAVLPAGEAHPTTCAFAREVASQRYYPALSACRRLIRLEEEVLGPLDEAA